MYDYLKSRWVLIATLTVFVLCKAPHLLLPFYWDESWPYVPAIKEMYRHGISLLPGAIDPNLSRGHPLFFHALGALWIHTFGMSNLSLHVFALCISLFFLVTIYEAGRRIFNERVGTIALLLVATHVSFFVQSSFVLFEVLVAFLCFLSIYLYTRQRYWLAALSLSALFLTKESGMIAGFVIGIDSLANLFIKNLSLKEKLYRLLPPGVACLAIGLFFLIQKQRLGWYVFPLYTDTILKKWDQIWFRFRTASLKTTFAQEYEYVIFIALLLLIAVAAFKQRTRKSLLLFSIAIPIVVGYLLMADRYYEVFTSNLRSQVALAGFIAVYAFGLVSYCTAFIHEPQQRKFTLLLGFFVLCFVLFSSVAYFIPRYLLASIIPGLFLLAVFLELLLQNSYRVLYYPLLVVVGLAAYLSFKNNKGWSDSDLGFANGIKTQMAIVKFMEDSSYYNKHIAACYLNEEHLSDPNTGFRSSTPAFAHVSYNIDSTTDIVIIDNIETSADHDGVAQNPSFKLIHEIHYKDVWGKIYERQGN